MTQHPDEGALHAYIDGELPPVEAEAIETHVAACASCGAALAEARGLAAAASRAISALDAAPSSARKAAMPAPAATAPTRRPVRPPIFRVPYARAAALLLLVGGTAVVIDRSGTLERGTASLAESPAADAAAPGGPALPIAAPEAASMAAPANTPQPSTARDLSRRPAAGASGTAAQKTSSGVAGGVATGAATSARRAERTMTPPAPAPVTTLRSADLAAAQQSAASSERVRAPVIGAASPASPPPPPPPARSTEMMRLSEVVVTGAVSPVIQVSRYRTREGVVLTLTEEPLRTTFAEESVATRTTIPPRVQQRGVAAMSAPAVNSFRWSSVEKGVTYTLAGPLTIAELEALSKRLGDLERVP